jgi:hypothetical protein
MNADFLQTVLPGLLKMNMFLSVPVQDTDVNPLWCQKTAKPIDTWKEPSKKRQ